MKISYAPDLSGKYCTDFSFTAPLKAPRGYKKDKSDVPERLDRAIVDFFRRVSDQVLGETYVALTGTELPSSYKIFAANGERPWRIDLNLTCPQGYDRLRFESAVLAEWAKCSVAGGEVFIRKTPFDHLKDCDNSARLVDPRKKSWWSRNFGDTKS